MNFLPVATYNNRRHRTLVIVFIIIVISAGSATLLVTRSKEQGNSAAEGENRQTTMPPHTIIQAINNRQWERARELTSNAELLQALGELERQDRDIENAQQFLSNLIIRWIVGPSALPPIAPPTPALSTGQALPLSPQGGGEVRGVSTEINNALSNAAQHITQRSQELALILPTLERLGRGEKFRTLVFFQNTTELRPTGGFWGSVAEATLGLNERTIEVENTYTLDAKADQSPPILPRPPKPLEQHLGIHQWYLRDRNWSPDFPTAAREALDAYRALSEDKPIDVVVVLNSTVLERLVAFTGELPLADRRVTHQTVVDTLEQLIEIDYPRYGYNTFTRKRFLGELLTTIADALARRPVRELLTLPQIVEELLEMREIQLYSTDPGLQQYFTQRRWDGGLPKAAGDGLMIVEANLASLKTNRLVDRRITYSLEQLPTGLEATATLTLTNNGHFDWRTTRYRTYVRFYVPQGARLISTQGTLRNERRLNPKELPSTVDITTEGDWTVFGVLTVVEPKETRSVIIRYQLPPSVIQRHDSSSRYQIQFTKQSGVKPIPLTIWGRFATTIVRSSVPLTEQMNTWLWQGSLQKTQQFWTEIE